MQLDPCGEQTQTEPADGERHLPVGWRHRIDLPHVAGCRRHRLGVSPEGERADQRRPRTAERCADDDDVALQRDRRDRAHQTRGDHHPRLGIAVLRRPEQADRQRAEPGAQHSHPGQIDHHQEQRAGQPTPDDCGRGRPRLQRADEQRRQVGAADEPVDRQQPPEQPVAQKTGQQPGRK